MSFKLSVDSYDFVCASFQLHHPTSQRSILFAVLITIFVMYVEIDQPQSMYGPSYMTTLIECNYIVVPSHTEFKLRMLVVLDITCVIKCFLSGRTGSYHNRVINL